MVLHGIALYDLVSYIIYFACFCVFLFVARAVSRKIYKIKIFNTEYKISLIRLLGHVTSVLTGKGWNLARDVTVLMTVIKEKTKSTAKR